MSDKTSQKKPRKKPKYNKPLSLHPLNPEQAISKFFQADPKMVEDKLKKIKD